jgi:hypothetical protein
VTASKIVATVFTRGHGKKVSRVHGPDARLFPGLKAAHDSVVRGAGFSLFDADGMLSMLRTG